MAMAGRTMNSRLKAAVTVDTAREADNGLLTPCVKEPDRVRIDQRVDGGLLTPCVKEPDGLITPCIKEADAITLALQGNVFVLGAQARAKGEILFDNPAGDRPYWDQDSPGTYHPAPEVTVFNRPLLYSSDFFLIA